MPRPRFDKLDPEKRQRIIEAAAQTFAAHGYEGASMNQLLEAAGISKGAAYYYFDDKADLFVTVVAHYFQGFLDDSEDLTGRLTRAGFWDEFAAYYRRAMSQFIDTPWTLGLLRAVWTLPPDARTGAALQPLFEAGQRWLLQLIRRGRELGTIRTDLPEDILLAWMLGLDAAMDRWMAINVQTMTEQVVEQMMTLSLDVLHRLFDPPGPGEEIDLSGLSPQGGRP